MTGLLRAVSFTAAVFIVAYGLLFTETHADLAWLGILAIAAVLLLIALIPRSNSRMSHVNRSIIVCGVVFVVGFLLLTAQLVRIQIVESAEIANRVEMVGDGSVIMNPRRAIGDAEVARGRIFTRDDEIVADTVRRDDGTYVRSYPHDYLAYVAGYHSPLLFGSSNLERQFNDVLLGQEGGNPFNEWLDGVLHRSRQGYDITLSLDSRLQRRADEMLADRAGSVIVMDSETGAVHTLVSKPNYDPNLLYTGVGTSSQAEIAQATEYWATINSSEGAPLIFRPTQGMYAPGSVFKTITAAAALESGLAEPDTMYRNEGALTVGSHVIIEQNLPDDRVNYSLTESYGYSLNVVFAQIGIQLGSERLLEHAQAFGFGESIPFDLAVNPSQVANDPAFLSDEVVLADTAFGQGQLFTTPLQMAVMTQAIVNDGEILEPYVVEGYSDADGTQLWGRSPSTWRRAISEETAEDMLQMMTASVESGYAAGAQIPGAIVGGKTGTAEVGDLPEHAWFVGFAGMEEPRYVVAVVVEHGGSGVQAALPIGREMLQMALEQLD